MESWKTKRKIGQCQDAATDQVQIGLNPDRKNKKDFQNKSTI
jgi:hypothetical protein